MNISRRKALVLASALAAAGFAAPQAASAQGFDKPVRIIVPYAPGGTSDTLARVIGPLLQQKIGQPVVVENKPGAAGNIGADAVAKADKDGHTYANSGVGGVNHITAVAMAKELGISWKAVPYKGGSAATQAVVSGESKVIINGATATLPFVTSGQLRGLALTGTERSAAAPNLPTFAEAKLPSADAGSWQAILGTAGSPPERIQAINAAVNEILKQPEVVERIKQQGGRVVGGSGDDLKTWLAANTESWGKIISDAGIKGQ